MLTKAWMVPDPPMNAAVRGRSQPFETLRRRDKKGALPA
jgi:hypothetical protein